MYDFVIKNGTLVTAGNSVQADLAVEGEKIVAIGQNLTGRKELDAAGKWITPGAVDIHVHMEMGLGEGVISADDFFTGTRAAAFGGTTTIIDFVEAEPDQTLLEGLQERRAAADPKVVIDYGLHMTLGPAEIPKLAQVPAVYAAGCTSFKMYMAYGFRLTDDQMMLALEAVRDVGGFPVVHAENWDVICTLVERNVAQGNLSPHWHPRSRPAALEGEAAGRVIDIAAYVGTPLHIFHVSCADVVERIAAARRRGLPITGETCPQYLYLTWDAYDKPGIDGTLPVCAPPLRPQKDQDALWQALSDGDLQIVTTDHCPFVKADKGRGLDNFSQIPGGVPSIEMRYTGVYSGGVANGRFSPNEWVNMCCTEPARLAGLKNKGDLAVGFDADIVIFDPQGTTPLSTETLHERVDWTPYEGITLNGAVETTIRRGEIIVDQGRFLGKAGDGRFINRAAE